MSYIIDIGGAPANEDCAQLGQTPDFEAVNTFEVLAYKLAIIAHHGTPPPPENVSRPRSPSPTRRTSAAKWQRPCAPLAAPPA